MAVEWTEARQREYERTGRCPNAGDPEAHPCPFCDGPKNPKQSAQPRASPAGAADRGEVVHPMNPATICQVTGGDAAQGCGDCGPCGQAIEDGRYLCTDLEESS